MYDKNNPYVAEDEEDDVVNAESPKGTIRIFPVYESPEEKEKRLKKVARSLFLALHVRRTPEEFVDSNKDPNDQEWGVFEDITSDQKEHEPVETFRTRDQAVRKLRELEEKENIEESPEENKVASASEWLTLEEAAKQAWLKRQNGKKTKR